jgi:multiple sugar transport system substrate-binding protein
MHKVSRVAAVVVAGALVAGLSACSNSGSSSGGDVSLQYWMWDDLQVPAYQKCADQFHEENPDITIEISQAAWSQYWTNLTTQMSAGSAPDVFVNQASYYPQFVEDKQIVDIAPMVEKSDIDLNQYVDGMADLWKVDDARYGLPKDWDTMGLVYNKAALAAAGVDEASLAELTWNPDDGGSFEQLIAALSVDKNGRNGLDPASRPTGSSPSGRTVLRARTAGATSHSPTAGPTRTRTRSERSSTTTTRSSSRRSPGWPTCPTRDTRRNSTPSRLWLGPRFS